MKKIIFIFVLALFMLPVLSAFSQEVPDTPVVENLTTPIDTHFFSIGILSLLVLAGTEFIKKWLKLTNSTIIQAVSSAIALLFATVGYLLNSGVFNGYADLGPIYGWVFTIVTGLGIGLIANGVYDAAFIRNWMGFIYSKIKPPVTQ